MSRLVRLEGKHTTQNAHCAVGKGGARARWLSACLWSCRSGWNSLGSMLLLRTRVIWKSEYGAGKTRFQLIVPFVSQRPLNFKVVKEWKERCPTPNILYNYGIQNDDLMHNKSPKTPKVGSQNHDLLFFFKTGMPFIGLCPLHDSFQNFLDQMSVPKKLYLPQF